MGRNAIQEHDVQVRAGDVSLPGTLSLPEGAEGLVVFVHGSGSSRHSPRSQFVASTLNEGGLATLLFDLLTPEEERIDIVTRHLRFDIEALAGRTARALDWLGHQSRVRALPVGLFGASTGAAAALMAAAHRPHLVRTVVSRGGRPDLAGPELAQVHCPVLLIVGELDTVVIDLNIRAQSQLQSSADNELVIVSGAGHLFEERGTLEQAAVLARDWFLKHLPGLPPG
jgi:putative phosphoribosyl transferase